MTTFDEKETSTTIAVHAFNTIQMFHLSVPLIVFSEVEHVGATQDWTTQVWSLDGQPVRTAEGVTLSDIYGPEILDDADILIFPAWPANLPAVDPELTRIIERAHARGAVIIGLCLGAFPVAASGIVDNRSIVTHWAAADQLAQDYPQVQVQPHALYIDHGDVLTSAGTASGLDACLHLVRERLGSRTATTVARQLVIAPHREGDQAQYIARPLRSEPVPGPVNAVIDSLLEHLDRPTTVEMMAQQAHMSQRNFTRVFTEITGTTPGKWLTQNRLNHARTLLESTQDSITDIARACGFASPVTFRQNFVAAFSTTPSSYRQRFHEQ
ncbi:GlxA family transcriptional regulator [Corynebacterium crudilactis]|uniref:AraC family transcriptional regulator n=1 Tax=Corynebacterium crudilactis TaxID=1652495 RepID=A0A172QQB1_9CORY|nr:helix-turn-helix domain-containing protein [Corynebacterium crudilactis]ANE02869.1 AraC family transcriptional regulator [Corynebacterium crudilactis]